MKMLFETIGLDYRVRDLHNNIITIIPMVYCGTLNILTKRLENGWMYRVNKT